MIKRYEIAPTDGLEEHVGEWEQIGKQRVRIKMKPESSPPQNYEVEILSLEDGVLKVRRLPVPGEQ